MKNLYAKLFAMLALALCLTKVSVAQELEVAGKVTDAKDGSGLPGVNVILVGTTTGTVTDINGGFRIKAGIGAVLEFRFLGYTTVTKTIESQSEVNISMKEETKNLKEAVVIGYGSVRKKDLTGAVSSVSSKDFQTGVITTADQLISAKVAGVQITPNGGGPGTGSTIRIRGGASLNASNDPLFVIDGVPVQGGIDGSPNPLSLINPNDIENVTVLRDASAAAIYGSRASNGVILITTKRGTKGAAPVLSITSQNSVSIIPKYASVLSASEFRKAVLDSGNATDRALITDSTTSTNWQKEIYQLARTFDQNISYGGSLWGVPFRVSGGYLNQTGILKTDKMERVTGALNISPSFLDGSLRLNVNLKGSYSTNFFANTGAIGAAVGYDPTKPVFAPADSNGVRTRRFGGYFEYLDSKGDPLSQAPRNPVAMLNQTTNESDVYRSIGNVTLDYTPKFFPDLTANLNLGYDVSRGSGRSTTSDSSALSYVTKGSSNKYRQDNRNLLGEFYLRYLKEIAPINSKVEVLAGTSFQAFHTRTPYFRGLSYRGDTIPGTQPLQFPYGRWENRIQSFYSRLIYTLNNKYIFTGTIRQDGSSRFRRENRWGFFPSAALAWVVSEEGFLKNQKVLSNLKLRLSFGETGQQDGIDNYGYLPRYLIGAQSVQYPFGNTFYTTYSPRAYDPNIRWESTTTYNAAVDFGFLDERISGSVDFYLKQTNDLINTIPIPSGSNFSDQVQTNVGNIENRGVEITINTVPVKTDKLIWDLGFNVTFNENKITRLIAVPDSNYIGVPTGGIGLGRTIQINAEGSPLNSFYVLEQVYDKSGKPIEGEFIDQNGDGRISAADFVKKGQPAPKMLFGLSTSVTWKKLTVGMVMRGNYGSSVFANQLSSGAYSSLFSGRGYNNNVSSNLLETNFDGNLADGPRNTNRLYSSYYLRDASFLRFDNINVSYNFGEVYKKLRVAANLNLQNPLVITKYNGIDPEIFSGIDNTIYPRPRVIVLGLSLTY